MNDPRLAGIEDYMNADQESVCTSQAGHILVEGVAGSRKTDTMIRLGLRRHLRDQRNVLFLTQVGSVTDEIRQRVEKHMGIYIHKQAGSNHYLASSSNGKTIEIANFDAWIHCQLQDHEWPHLRTMGAYHSFKMKALSETMDKFRGFCMKNGEYAEEVLIDECQDFEPLKAQLLVDLLKKAPHVRSVFCGDYMQTIFDKSIDKELPHPMRIFAGLAEERFYLQKCFRCPAAQIRFANAILHEPLSRYKCRPLLPVQPHDEGLRPFLFTYNGITKLYDVHQLVGQLCDMVRSLVKKEPDLRPSDFCFLMRRSNNQPVFNRLRNSLSSMWSSLGYENAVIHFATQFDGHRNSIQWNYAVGRSCLISIHGDKGKGHKVVFFLGLAQKSIPDECAMHKDVELIYHSLLNVALTRSTRHLIIGLPHAQPSVYLSSIQEQLPDLVYASWLNNKGCQAYDEFSTTPAPDFTKSFRSSPLMIPTLNMLQVADVSRRYERHEDLFGFRPKVETSAFGSKVRLHDMEEDGYVVVGLMAELMLLHVISPDLFLQDLAWFPSRVVFSDDERLRCWMRDFRLHDHVGNNAEYQKVMSQLMDKHRTTIDKDEHLSMKLQELSSGQKYLLPTFFQNPRFHNGIMRLRQDASSAPPHAWWDAALLFHEIHHSHAKVFDVMTDHAFVRPIMANVTRFASLLSRKVVMKPSHDMMAHITDPTQLKMLGFEPDVDNHYYENGYFYGMRSRSSLMDDDHKTLYLIKARPVVDLPVEWQVANSINACVQFTARRAKNLVVVNMLHGKMHKWNCPTIAPKVLVRRVMTSHSFPDHLIDHLCRVHHKRLQHTDDIIVAKTEN